MSIRVALHHTTSYEYERPIRLSPQIVRLRPAPHCRTPVTAYSLRVEPPKHFINWQQDPQGNYLARLVFPDPVERFKVEIDLIADMTVINPFDFFLEESAEFFPFQYESWLSTELKPFLVAESPGPHLAEWLNDVDRSRAKTVSFLVDLNRRLHADVRYLIRMEPGVQTCEETLERGQGSCRDSAWLLVQILRNLGLAARFVSGYLIQLTPDVKALDGPNGPEQDFTDLHAWVEVYLPGAGWV
ncbi:MAG: transglutaminase family protein, partial [Planctomycetales bacterium]|nr:transglutaminase family protein [Planctomycetales bacterium]